MTTRSWGSIRKVILDFASDFVEVNEDLELVSQAKTKKALKRGGDLFPRGYYVPDAEITLKCKAARIEGKVKLFGLGGVEGDHNSMEVTIRIPFATKPLNERELEKIIQIEEDKISAELKKRGVEGVGGDYFIPDTE